MRDVRRSAELRVAFQHPHPSVITPPTRRASNAASCNSLATPVPKESGWTNPYSSPPDHRPRQHGRLLCLVVTGLRAVRADGREPHHVVDVRKERLLQLDRSVDDLPPSNLVLVDRHRRKEPFVDDSRIPDLPTIHPHHGQATRIPQRGSSNGYRTNIVAKRTTAATLISMAATIPARTLRLPVRFLGTDLHPRCCAVGSNLLLPGGKVAAACRTPPIAAGRPLMTAAFGFAVADHRSR